MSARTQTGGLDSHNVEGYGEHLTVSSSPCCPHALVPPIRSLTVREPVRFPSRRSLQCTDVDGHDDAKSEQEIKKALSRLESLVQQITELAEESQTQPVSKTQQPSDDAGRRDASPTEKYTQPCAAAHGELIGTKAGPSKPQISITLADDIPPEHHVLPGSAKKTLRQNLAHKIREPSEPPPPLPTYSGSETLHTRQSSRRNHRKPTRREVSPFEDEEMALKGLDVPRPGHERHFTQMFGIRHHSSTFRYDRSQTSDSHMIDLRRVNHVDLLNKPKAFDVYNSCNHAPIARHWSDSKKRCAATVVCLNAAIIGLIIGMYSGEVPAIQYVIADFHHFAILGNVFLYSGLSISTLLLWPLPLLHGRKVYTVTGLVLALGLQIPQGISLIRYRMPDEVA